MPHSALTKPPPRLQQSETFLEKQTLKLSTNDEQILVTIRSVIKILHYYNEDQLKNSTFP